jgi:hypothetical protein
MNSGQYECEGHVVSFLVEEKHVVVKQIYDAPQSVSEHTFELDKDKAITYQDKLISLGYTKVS